MLCPSCQIDYPAGTKECPKCGVALDKWHGGKGHTLSQGAGEQRSNPVILYGGLAVAVLGAILYFRRGAPAPEGEGGAAPAAPTAAVVVEAGEDIPDPWRFEGAVADLRTAAPVAGVKVDFIYKGKAYRAVTDENGRYKREVPALESGSYAVALTHPAYHPRYQRGTPDMLAEESRGRTICAQFGQTETVTGATGQAVQADFLVCPKQR